MSNLEKQKKGRRLQFFFFFWQNQLVLLWNVIDFSLQIPWNISKTTGESDTGDFWNLLQSFNKRLSRSQISSSSHHFCASYSWPEPHQTQEAGVGSADSAKAEWSHLAITAYFNPCLLGWPARNKWISKIKSFSGEEGTVLNPGRILQWVKNSTSRLGIGMLKSGKKD